MTQRPMWTESDRITIAGPAPLTRRRITGICAAPASGAILRPTA